MLNQHVSTLIELLLQAAQRIPADDSEIVTCSDCGRCVPYGYIAHHYQEPVHSGCGLAPDWVTRLVCRDCAPHQHEATDRWLV